MLQRDPGSLVNSKGIDFFLSDGGNHPVHCRAHNECFSYLIGRDVQTEEIIEIFRANSDSIVEAARQLHARSGFANGAGAAYRHGVLIIHAGNLEGTDAGTGQRPLDRKATSRVARIE